jgi:type VI secretion system secreted protein VgrG
MTPNGQEYWNPGDYEADFSLPSLALSKLGWFVHEGTHLYQHYGLKWNVTVRGAVSRNYNYTLVPAKKKLSDYKLEEMGDIASDYYKLKQGGSILKPYSLSDYAGLLPIP